MVGLGALISGGLGLAKGIFGGVQALKGNKQMNSLLNNRPQYNISQGYQDSYKTYQRLAGSQMPGYGQMQNQIGEATAKATSTAEQGAMSSGQFMNAALGAQDKELDAIRNLGIMSSQWRGQQQQNMAQEQNFMGGLQDQQFQTNQLDPYNMKLQMASEQKSAGMQNLFSGLGEAGGAAMNFLGTSDYLKVLKGLQPQGGIGGGGLGAAKSIMSKAGQYSPQSNLNGTLGNMFSQWQTKNG